MAFSMFDLYQLPPIHKNYVKGPYEYPKANRPVSPSATSDSFRLDPTPTQPVQPGTSFSHFASSSLTRPPHPSQSFSKEPVSDSPAKVVASLDFSATHPLTTTYPPLFPPPKHRPMKALAKPIPVNPSRNYMENRRIWAAINKRQELPKAPIKRRKPQLNRSLQHIIDPPKKLENEKMQPVPAKLMRSTTMLEFAAGKKEEDETDFIHRRVSQVFNSVKAEIHEKLAMYVKHPRVSYLRGKGANDS